MRLGIRTLGDLASLPAPAVLGRLAPQREPGPIVWRRGEDGRSLAARTPPPDLAVTAELDPPAERVDRAAFVAKSLADELDKRLAGHGLACTPWPSRPRPSIGEQLVRRWRHEGALTATAPSERARWQLDGWLTGREPARPRRVTLLRLTPEEVTPDDGRQLGFWGGGPLVTPGRARALARVQGLLGPEAVATAGGRRGSGPGRPGPPGDVG